MISRLISLNKERHRSLWGALSIALLMVGCDIPERPPLDPPEQLEPDQPTAAADVFDEAIEPPETVFAQDWESWDAYYLNNQPVGYSHLTAEALLGDAIQSMTEANVRYTLVDQIRFRRGNATFVQHLEQASTETAQGVLVDFDSTLHVGPIVTRFRGVVSDGELKIETVRGSTRSSLFMAWQSTYRGMVAIQQSLRRTPIKRHQRRTLQALTPIQHEITTIKLYCTGPAAIAMLDGTPKKVTEVEAQYLLGDKAFAQQVIWIDDDGEIQKTLRPADGLVSFRTDKATALRHATEPGDLLKSTRVDVTGVLDRPTETTQVGYLVLPNRALAGQETQFKFQPQPWQYVRDMVDGSSQVLVRQDGSPPSGFRSTTLAPVPEDLSASPFIDFENRGVQRIAGTAGSAAGRSETELAIDLADIVKDWIKPLAVSDGLAKASTIADDEEGGGCLERAVLLTALLRARKIPARLALGFVYVPGDKPYLAFHVWNLAHVDGQWLALDAGLGTSAPADRIMLATTNLSAGQEYESFKPIMQSLGQFRIDIRGAKYKQQSKNGN